MCLCTLCSRRFVAAATPSAAFLDYCRERGLPRVRTACGGPWIGNWRDAVTALPTEQRIAVEREVEAASELGTPEGNAHLLEATGLHRRPPPPDRAPSGGVPLALWYVVRHPAYFWDVYHAHERRADDEWHAARVPADRLGAGGLRISAAVADTLGAILFGDQRSPPRPVTSTGAVTLHEISGGAVCAVAGPCAGHGDRRTRRSNNVVAHGPAPSLQLACYPAEGSLLLKSTAYAPAAAFARAALGRITRDLLGDSQAAWRLRPAFDLDVLKASLRAAPDAPDMEAVRVKTLHLRYPEREGRRLLALDTLTVDSRWSIDEMLARHAGSDLDRLDVTHAVLQVRLAGDGTRPRNHLVRLWPDRCDLGRGALGDRMLRCLRLWGI